MSLTNIALALSLFFTASSAGATAPCADLLKWPTFRNKIENLFSVDFAEELLTELRPQVSRLLEEDSNFKGDNIERIYRLYLERRLAALSPQIRELVRDLIDSDVKVSVYDNSSGEEAPLSAYSHRGIYMVFLTVSEAAHRSPLDYFVRVHEIEHIIQYHSAGVFALGELHPFHHTNTFYIEQGAMRSEGVFLKLFPQAYLEKLLEHWRAQIHKKGFTDELYENSLSHAAQSANVQEYLELQQQSGRYNRATFADRELKRHLSFWTVTALVSSPLWLKILGVY